MPLLTTAFGSNQDFSIYDITFYWYKVLGVVLVWLLAIPLSYIWKSSEEKLNPKLFTPFVRRFLTQPSIEMEEMPLKTAKYVTPNVNTAVVIPLNPEENNKRN